MHGGVWQAGNGSFIASTEPVWPQLTLLTKPSHDLNSLHYTVGNANMELCIVRLTSLTLTSSVGLILGINALLQSLLLVHKTTYTNNCFLCVLLYKE